MCCVLNARDSIASVKGDSICKHEFSAQQLAVQPKYTENEDSSIIAGDTARELLTALANEVPNSGVGFTRWTVRWRFDSKVGARGCLITNVRSETQVNYQLPLWPDQLFALDRELTGEWNQYSDALRQYHCEHGKAGIDAAIEVKQRLSQLGAKQSCERLRLHADEEARSVVRKYREIEAGYNPPIASDYIGKTRQ